MIARRAALLALGVMLAVTARDACAGSPVPAQVLRTIREAAVVRLLHLGGARESNPLDARTPEGALLGRAVRERVVLTPEESGMFRNLLGSASTYGDTSGAHSMVSRGGTLMGFAFEAPGEFVRVVIAPVLGAVHVEYFNGARWDMRLSEQGRMRWAAVLERYLVRHGQAMPDFDREFNTDLPAGSPASPAVTPGARRDH